MENKERPKQHAGPARRTPLQFPTTNRTARRIKQRGAAAASGRDPTLRFGSFPVHRKESFGKAQFHHRR
ncbi:hypothetical protein NL676_000667 [Syzygium grande]|nr:hypothetical protein NL676_000667 [Syzygium grande]